MTVKQMREIAAISEKYGSGSIRFTVWQNLILADIPNERIPDAQRALEKIGLDWKASSLRAGLVACTGNAGCKFAASNTKGHALKLANALEAKFSLEQPINIHLTGCHHSCAQHYIGDIGLLATKVEAGDDMVEGYHVYVGGGYGPDRNIGRELYRDVAFNDLEPLLAQMLQTYVDHRSSPTESFSEFAMRHSTDALLDLFQNALAIAE